jgi:F-type H+-transporting ATPase subunit b
MLIDWFTIVAQIFNFLILLWLLKRFLYKPILNAMDEREQKITYRLREAQRAEQEAEREAREFREKAADLDSQRDRLILEARNEAEALRKDLLHQARQEVDQAQERWFRSIQQNKEAFLRDLYQRVSTQTYVVARRALSDLANEDLETHIIETFLIRLRDLKWDERESLHSALENSNETITIRSAFEISDDLRDEISQQMDALVSNSYQISYEVMPDLMSGIELKLAGKKISWSLSSYMEDLEQNLAEALRERVQELDQLKAIKES